MSDDWRNAVATAAYIPSGHRITETKVKALRCGQCGSPSKRVPVGGYLTCEHCETVSAVDRCSVDEPVGPSPFRVHYF